MAATTDERRHQMPPVFISHCGADAALATALADKLTALRMHNWLALRDMPPGASYPKEIVRAVSGCVAVAVVLSHESMGSANVMREMNLAVDAKKLILPLTVDLGLADGVSLPDEWRYWLGIVQISLVTDAQSAAGLVKRRVEGLIDLRVGASPNEAGVSDPAEPPVVALPPTPGPKQHGRIRSLLIQAGVDRLSFETTLSRANRIGVDRAAVIAVAYQLRDSRLIDFDGDLTDASEISIT